jgi:hypothetical protein
LDDCSNCKQEERAKEQANKFFISDEKYCGNEISCCDGIGWFLGGYKSFGAKANVSKLYY